MSISDSIFWVEVDKIKPNPFQPRRAFDEVKLRELAESIRQYGVLQPLVVTRAEVATPDGGLAVEYELIAGERRLRASKIAGVSQVPVVIRREPEDESDRMKLELAIIENIQREDLNPIERARAFKQLAHQFNFKHHEIAKKVGKSREYVSNSLRLLTMPDEMVNALFEGKIAEGHTRPLLMLTEHPEEQATLFKDILVRRLTVREAERIARHTALERARKKTGDMDPKILEWEKAFAENLGTRVQIEMGEGGGRIFIDVYSPEDVLNLLKRFAREEQAKEEIVVAEAITGAAEEAEDDVPRAEANKNSSEDDLYSIKNFTI